MPLSDFLIVKKLILERSFLDPFYYPDKEPNSVYTTTGIGLFAEPVQCTFIDLDILIGQCSFSQCEDKYLHMFMNGYTVRDIAEARNVSPASVSKVLKKIVRKIVNKNNDNWNKCYTKKFSGKG